jgi:hypothetical protein
MAVLSKHVLRSKKFDIHSELVYGCSLFSLLSLNRQKVVGNACASAHRMISIRNGLRRLLSRSTCTDLGVIKEKPWYIMRMEPWIA